MRQSQYTHALIVHLFDKFLCFVSHIHCQWLNLSIKLGIRAHTDHLFYGSFGDDLSLSVQILHNDRHTPAREIERNLIYLLIRTA